MLIKILFTSARFVPVFCRDSFRIDSASEPKGRQRTWHRRGDLLQKPRSILSEVEALFLRLCFRSRFTCQRTAEAVQRSPTYSPQTLIQALVRTDLLQKRLFHPKNELLGRQIAPLGEPPPYRNGIFALKIHKNMPKKKAPTTRENTKNRHIPYPEDGFLEGKATVTPQTTGKRQDFQ